jgi:hypothetical protein
MTPAAVVQNRCVNKKNMAVDLATLLADVTQIFQA